MKQNKRLIYDIFESILMKTDLCSMKAVAEKKYTLGLKLPTDPRWVDLTQFSLQDILTDHAYCEQKATSAMISLIQQYAEREGIVELLSPVVAEEWGHFRAVLAQLKKRGLSLGEQRQDMYVKKLMKGKKKGQSRDGYFLDMLLICAMIEARSCERFKTLSRKLDDPELKEFYHQFMVAEASHYKLFLKLAKMHFEESVVMERWQYWLDYEASFIKDLPLRGDRLH